MPTAINMPQYYSKKYMKKYTDGYGYNFYYGSYGYYEYSKHPHKSMTHGDPEGILNGDLNFYIFGGCLLLMAIACICGFACLGYCNNDPEKATLTEVAQFEVEELRKKGVEATVVDLTEFVKNGKLPKKLKTINYDELEQESVKLELDLDDDYIESLKKVVRTTEAMVNYQKKKHSDATVIP